MGLTEEIFQFPILSQTLQEVNLNSKVHQFGSFGFRFLTILKFSNTTINAGMVEKQYFAY
jgi:hypothetical protein